MNNPALASENADASSPLPAKEPSEKKVENSEIDYKEAMKNKPPDFDTWTECKKQAWLHLDDNPNAFFYRNVMPGEIKKNGQWSESEKIIFLKALKEHPPIQGGWGLFSRYIPSRVGYQCNAFYKKLVASGEVEEIVSINKRSTSNTNNNNANTNTNNNNNNNTNNNNNESEISTASNITNPPSNTNNSIKKSSRTSSANHKKAVAFQSSGSSRLQSIVSFLYENE